MTAKEVPPAVPEKARIPLRVGAVILGYIVYRLLADEGVMGPAFIGFGTAFLGFVLVDRYATWRRDRSGLLQVGTTLLALGFLGLGAYLMLR